MQVAVERRPTLFFLIVLGALFLLMATSTRTRRIGEATTLFERAVITTFSPVPKIVNAVGRNTRDIYHGYIDMRRAVTENLTLSRRVAELTKENLMLRESHGDLARMRGLLSYSEQFSMPALMAQIILHESSGRFRAAVLDRGSDHGVEVNDAIVNTGGLVGRVVLTTKDLAKAQLIIDRNSSVGALLERSRRQGVIRGDGAGGMQMFFVPALTDVVPGDSVITAGIDGIYPKGIPVARVVKVEEGKDLFKTIYCKPTVDFSSLEDVIILRTRKIPAEVERYVP